MNETRRILDLLAQGKITADEAEQLIAAVAPSSERPAEEPTNSKAAPKWLRVTVFKVRAADRAAGVAEKKKEINIRIPISLVHAGMKLGAIIPEFAGEEVNRKLREKGIDLSKLDASQIDGMLKELNDLSVDMDDGKHQVRVFCE